MEVFLPHEKLRKMLEMLIMLGCRYGRTRKGLADHFGISERTVSRYFNTFKEAGFVLENNGGYWKINKKETTYKDLSQLLHFSQEESYILRKAIESVEAPEPLKEELTRKLYSIYNFDRVATPLIKTDHADKVEKLMQAIRQKKQAFLYRYHSSHSGTIIDRLVEPFDFTHNYHSLWAFEVETGENKTFTVDRIDKLDILDSPWQYKEKHRKLPVDIFRVCDEPEVEVKVRLSLRARNLLVEEYPLSEKYIKKINDNEYILHTRVSGFGGIARFVMGLIDETEVLEPDGLREVIRGKVEKMQIR